MKIRLFARQSAKDIVGKLKTLKRKKNLTFDEQAELTELEEAHKIYESNGEVYHTKELAINISVEQVRKCLTNKRMRLLEMVKSKRFDSIGELARLAKRDVKNVYQDIKVLESLGLVKLEKGKRNTVVKPVVEEIRVEL